MARRNRSTRRKEPAPGWLWMLFGLGIGLVVAAGVYWRDARVPAAAGERAAAATPAAARGKETAPGAAAASGGTARNAPRRGAAPPPARTPEAADSRFDFYELLPQYEVVVPEVETVAGTKQRTQPVVEPGNYVLQAGSFAAMTDADRLKASIALLGIESRIQRVQVDDATFHRVRIGPISDLERLNRIRKQLHDAHIDTMVMKASE